MALKKLSISEEEVEIMKELLAKKLSGRAIAKKLKRNQVTIWRNMELLGLNCKKKIVGKKGTIPVKNFNWKDFNNSIL